MSTNVLEYGFLRTNIYLCNCNSFFDKCNKQTALNNSASDALSEFCSNKNDRHLWEILRNSELFNTSLVFAPIILAHFSFNFRSASQSIVYCSTVKTFIVLRLSSKNASHWWMSVRIKYFFARKCKIIPDFYILG